ncbi:MAG: MATE family efflux transporter [Oscillospiraceae bacterium]|nr:MATE family efflux transporter [Oscillospiraceae bacterium]
MLNDLTTGSPGKIILRFSTPLLLSTAIQQIYNITDSVIVGRFVGSGALAAIGAAYPITLFFVAMATGSSMGCSVIISQLFGAKKMARMKSAVFTAIISLFILGVAVSALGIILSRPLMRILNASDDIFRDASMYLAIYSAGVLPLFIYNTANAIFTGLGVSKKPLYFLIFSSILNVVLDLVAVRALHMGVTGSAWATTVSITAAAALAVVSLISQIRRIDVGEKTQVFSRELLGSMARIAVPSIFQQSCVALAHTIVQGLVNTFSTSVIAGYEVASKIHNFAYMSFNTLGTALSSYAAQNFGAGKKDRIRQGYRASTAMCFTLTVAVVLVMQVFPAQLIRLFIDGSKGAEVIEVGVKFLRIISPDYLIICFIITTGGLMRGVGRIRDFFIVTVVDFTVRVAMCFILTGALNSYTGLFWAWYFGSTVDVIPCLLIYAWMCRKGELRLGA